MERHRLTIGMQRPDPMAKEGALKHQLQALLDAIYQQVGLGMVWGYGKESELRNLFLLPVSIVVKKLRLTVVICKTLNINTYVLLVEIPAAHRYGPTSFALMSSVL